MAGHIRFILGAIFFIVLTTILCIGMFYLITKGPTIKEEPVFNYTEDCLNETSLTIRQHNNFLDKQEAIIFLIDNGFVPPQNLSEGFIDVFFFDNIGSEEVRVCVDGVKA